MGFTMTSTDAITDTGTGQVEPERVRQYGDVFSEFASTQDPEGPDQGGEEGGAEETEEERRRREEGGDGEGEQPAVPENPPEPASTDYESRSISYGEDK